MLCWAVLSLMGSLDCLGQRLAAFVSLSSQRFPEEAVDRGGQAGLKAVLLFPGQPLEDLERQGAHIRRLRLGDHLGRHIAAG